MKKMKTMLYFVLCACILTVQAYAEEFSNAELTDRLKQVEENLKSAVLPDSWVNKVTVSGSVELEASYAKSDPAGEDVEGEDSSDFSLSTAEIGIDADIVEHVTGHVLFLYEDDEDVVVDEATITILGGEAFPVFLTAGKMYVPFGKYETNMISDPLTLELGETRETAVQAGFESGGFHASFYVFNGDVNKADSDDHIDNYGLEAGYALEKDGFKLDVGVGYINNIMDSNTQAEILDDETADAESMGFSCNLNEYVGGFSAYVTTGVGPFTFIGEYVAAIEEPEFSFAELEPGVLQSMGFKETKKGEKPRTWNLELAYIFSVMEKDAVIALSYQGSDNTDNQLPDKRYLAACGINLLESTNLSVEYLHGKYENEDEEDVVTAKLAIEF